MLTALPITTLLFYAFAALLIISALMVIFSKNPVQSALYLVLAFFASTALWIMAQAEFLGLILILVYVGAVMTLFLFVVMTVPLIQTPQAKTRLSFVLLALLSMVFFVGLMAKAFAPFHQSIFQIASEQPPSVSNAAMIGNALYTQYVFPFEIAGLLLLVAIIAAVSLSWKVNRSQKIINNEAEQIAVSAKSRLKIIKMASEKKTHD